MRRSVVMDLVFEEISRRVAEAAAEESILWAPRVARQIKDLHPSCLLSEQLIEDLVIGFSIKSGVAVRYGQDWHKVPYSADTGVRL